MLNTQASFADTNSIVTAVKGRTVGAAKDGVPVPVKVVRGITTSHNCLPPWA